MDLTGKVAWVTGAARGQGLSHALALGKAGATVFITDIADNLADVTYPLPTQAELDSAASSLRDLGIEAYSSAVDNRDSAQVNAFVQQIRDKKGRLDILVANAGVCFFQSAESMTDSQWSTMVDTNLTGTFNTIRAAIPLMTENHWGRIVATSSGAGRGGMMDLSHYAASKWGVIGLVKSVALEVGSAGITANVVSPSSVRTPMIENPTTQKRFRPDLSNPTLEDAKPAFAALSPLDIPWLEADDVTRAVMYFIEDPGKTSGTVLEVNLGTTAGRQ